jgi:hypothetical protein
VSATERGDYLTRNRALAIEREIGELEGRLMARVDRLEAELAEQRRAQVDVLRAQATAMLETLRSMIGADAGAHTTREE